MTSEIVALGEPMVEFNQTGERGGSPFDRGHGAVEPIPRMAQVRAAMAMTGVA